MMKMVEWYIVVINVAAFCAFGIDKRKAELHRWRIPEARLLALSAAGGAAGALAGMHIFHHKTRKSKFAIGVPLLLAAQILIFILLYKLFG